MRTGIAGEVTDKAGKKWGDGGGAQYQIIDSDLNKVDFSKPTPINQ